MPGEIARATGRSGTAVERPAGQPSAAATEMQAVVSAYEHSLATKMAAARQLATANLLPRQYQNHPGNVLWAMEYGQALNISPIAVMLGIWVTPDGKPAASSQMMQALVRSKGHKLRLTAAPDGQSATCTIIRKDDLDEPTVVTYTMEMAKTAKLTGKKNWQENPVAMLKARAAAMCCRDACSEVLLGMYTPDELGADVPDDELPDAGYRPGSAGSHAAPVEEGPESPASDERIRDVVEAFRARGMRHIGEIQDAIETIISPRRDGPVPRPPDVTVEECQFIMDELENLHDLQELRDYLAPDIMVVNGGSEEGIEA